MTVNDTEKSAVVEVMPGRLLFRPEEAAQVLGLGRTKLYELMASGELRSVKLGNSRRVSARALAEYVDQLDRAGAA